jgi:hypothetical protein
MKTRHYCTLVTFGSLAALVSGCSSAPGGSEPAPLEAKTTLGALAVTTHV